MPTSETAIRAKAADLGAALPRFTMASRPELFSAWAERVALADSLRHSGKPYRDAVAECDRQLGIARAAAKPEPVLPVGGDSLWLDRIAALLGDVAAPAVVGA